jgi:cell division protein FtsL
MAIAVVALAFALAAILHVRSKLVVLQLGYALSEATREHKRLQADLGKLRVEVATLLNPRRLRRLATQQLGLKEPEDRQVVRWEPAKRRQLAMHE